MAHYNRVASIKKMLPKTYVERRRVAYETYVALTHYKCLVPLMEKYVFNDGTTKELMSLSGTVPVLFNGKKYNIPICLWLQENHPRTAPICYVRPTGEMMIVRGRFISGNGEVLLPYLQEWRHPDSNLLGLLQVMSVTFGEFPPLCVRASSEPEPASCPQQVQRRAEESYSYLRLDRDDGQPFQQDNDTIC